MGWCHARRAERRKRVQGWYSLCTAGGVLRARRWMKREAEEVEEIDVVSRRMTMWRMGVRARMVLGWDATEEVVVDSRHRRKSTVFWKWLQQERVADDDMRYFCRHHHWNRRKRDTRQRQLSLRSTTKRRRRHRHRQQQQRTNRRDAPRYRSAA